VCPVIPLVLSVLEPIRINVINVLYQMIPPKSTLLNSMIPITLLAVSSHVLMVTITMTLQSRALNARHNARLAKAQMQPTA
jgi:hypothetical protein